MINWKLAEKELPKKDGSYLCYIKTNHGSYYEILSFSNDLYKVDNYDFQAYRKKKKRGFYDYSSEFGYYEYEKVTCWSPLPDKEELEEHLGIKEEEKISYVF